MIAISLNDTNLVERALLFSTEKHLGSKRKFSDDPYIIHPTRIAAKVALWDGTADMIAAAFLHDTVEDCEVTHEEIKEKFGQEVSDIVRGLTNAPKTSGNRKLRKTIDLQRLMNADWRVQTIKVLDIDDNSNTMCEGDPHYAPIWLKECLLILDSFTKVNVNLLDLVKLKIDSMYDAFLTDNESKVFSDDSWKKIIETLNKTKK